MRYIKSGSAAFLVAIALGISGLGCSKEARLAQHQEKGDKYYQAGDYQKAEIEYLNALRLQPENLHVISRLGIIYLDEGRGERAYAFLRKARELEPRDAEIRCKLADIYVAAREKAKALEELNGALANNPASADAIMLLAELAVTPEEIQQTRAQLAVLRQKTGDSQALHMAQGLLALGSKDLQTAEAEYKQALSLAPNVPNPYAALGNLYWMQNDFAQAERYLKEAASKSPTRSAFKLRYAEFKLARGDQLEATRQLGDILKAAPDFLPALIRLTELELARNHFDRTSELLTRALLFEPTAEPILLLKGRMELAKREPAKAVATLERVVEKNPRWPEAQFFLSVAYLANDETLKGVAGLEQVVAMDPAHARAVLLLSEIQIKLGRPEEPYRHLTELLRRQPSNESAYLMLGDSHRLRGALDEALSVYSAAATRFPTNARAPFLVGVVQRRQDKVMEARKSFERAIALAPDFLLAIEQLVEMDIAQKNFSNAFQRLAPIKQRHPKAPDPVFLEASIHLAMGDTNRAIVALKQAIANDPNFRASYLLLARTLADSMQVDKAIDELNQALKLRAKDIGFLMLKGMLQEIKKDHKGACDTYEALLAINPDFSPALNNLAYLYAVPLKQPEKGLDSARKARRLSPNEAAISDTMGWILFQTGDYSGALPLFQESAGKLRDEAEVQYHLGMAHYMMGNEAQARTALRKAVQDEKEFAGKDDAKRKLQILGDDSGTSGARTVEALEKAIAQDRADMVAMLRLAALYEKSGSAAKAKEMAEASLKLNSKAARALLVLARVYASQPGETQRAVDYAKNARALAPDDPEIIHAAGAIAFQSGQHEWAYSILQECLRKLPNDPDAACDYAWAAYSVGRVAEAINAMQTALHAGTNFSRAAPARQFVEIVSLATNPVWAPTATATVEAALKADPTYVPALFAAAVAWERRADHAQAQRIYEQVLARYPQFTPAARQLALLFAEDLNNPQKGYELATKARVAFPDDLELARALAKLAYKKGEYQYTAQLLKDYVQKRAGDAEAYYYLGLAQHQLKQGDGAASLRRALELKLEPKLAQEANRILASAKP